MNNIAFVICCKNSKYIHKCVESINTFYPSSTIYVVDSCSEDKSYFDIQNKYKNVIIKDISNKNYEYGAYLYCFNEYKNDHEIFVFMQDSIYLQNEIKKIFNLKDQTAYVFDKNYTGWSSGVEHKELFYKINTEFPKTDLSNILMFIYNSFIITSNTFNLIINSNIFKLAQPPNDKMTSCAWERAWSIIFYENGINIDCIDTNSIKKIYGNRQ
jgi:hypothetical protein